MNKLKLIRAKLLLRSIKHKGSLSELVNIDIHGFNFSIEGYPRSANTTVSYLLLPLLKKQFHDIDTVIHHTHSLKTVQFCLLMNIPQLILIRDPASAIVSNYIYHNGRVGLDRMTQKWIDYYKVVEKHKSRLLLAGFSSATNDINSIILKVNDRYDMELPPIDDLDAQMQAMKNTYREHTEEKRGDDYFTIYPLPDNKRDTLREELLGQIPVSGLKKATTIYQNLIGDAV